MIKFRKYLLTISLALCTCLIWSCTQTRQPCLTPKRASLKIRCVLPAPIPTDAKAVKDSPLTAAVLIPLTGVTPLNGTVYAKQATFTLSLSPTTDSCLWMIATDTTAGSKFDTLTFHYNRQLNFISNACGYVYFYGLTSVQTTHNNIDSVTILNGTVNNNVNTNHLQVYIHH